MMSALFLELARTILYLSSLLLHIQIKDFLLNGDPCVAKAKPAQNGASALNHRSVLSQGSVYQAV